MALVQSPISLTYFRALSEGDQVRQRDLETKQVNTRYVSIYEAVMDEFTVMPYLLLPLTAKQSRSSSNNLWPRGRHCSAPAPAESFIQEAGSTVNPCAVGNAPHLGHMIVILSEINLARGCSSFMRKAITALRNAFHNKGRLV